MENKQYSFADAVKIAQEQQREIRRIAWARILYVSVSREGKLDLSNTRADFLNNVDLQALDWVVVRKESEQEESEQESNVNSNHQK